MKHLLITTIAAVLLVGCATTQSPEPPTVKAPAISIYDAADRGNIEAVKQHITAGTDVNAKSDGRTPLHWAAYSGHKEIAELLIGEGAEMNAKERDGRTPLDNAINHPETANLLRYHGGKADEELKAEGK